MMVMEAPEIPTDPFTSDDLVPPVAVAVIDGLLKDIGGQTFIDRHKVEDMLLEVRNAIWSPNQFSLAVAPLLDSVPAGGSPKA